MNSLMGNNQAMSNAKQKAESTGVFSLHPSPAPRLCVNSSSPVGVAKHRLILFWNTAVLLFLLIEFTDCTMAKWLEDCRIYTSFFSFSMQNDARFGRLPYLYLLLLDTKWLSGKRDWKIAVFILPSTRQSRRPRQNWNTAVLLLPFTFSFQPPWYSNWKTAVFILPFTPDWGRSHGFQIGILPYYHFLLLPSTL